MLQAGKQMDVPEAPSAPSLLSEAGREPIKALRQRMRGYYRPERIDTDAHHRAAPARRHWGAAGREDAV